MDNLAWACPVWTLETPSARVLWYFLSIPNHFDYCLTIEMQSHQRKELCLSVVLLNNMNHIGSVLWANFMLPSPTMQTDTHMFNMQNGSVINHCSSLLLFQYLSRYGSQSEGDSYKCLRKIWYRCFKKIQIPDPHSKLETYSTRKEKYK